MNRLVILPLIVLPLLSGACAQKGLYEWGPYEGGLHTLYRSPGSEREFAQDLRMMIEKSRQKGTRIPPGVAAEYGFLQYKAGQLDDAVEYFDLERRTWPESAVLMTKLITRIDEEKRAGQAEEASPDEDVSGGQGPDAAAEAGKQ